MAVHLGHFNVGDDQPDPLGDLVTILDFEKIVAEIAPETTIQMSEIERLGHRERQGDRIS